MKRPLHRNNFGGHGFTLLELLLALAVIGVLCAIAIPVYNGHIAKMKINTAITDIYQMQSCIERYYTETFQYPPTIETIASCLPNNGNDPWGNAYVYLNIINGGPGIKGKVRKDKKVNPINSLYDLYSMGKDGDTKIQLDNKLSVDDIVLGRDGGFVGLASDF
jgi:general secretion pathway protein G